MKQIPQHFILPTTNMQTLVHRVDSYLSDENEVIELKGFPMRIFCFKKPEFIGQVLKSPLVGTMKSPVLMPRVKWTMKSGAYIKVGGEDWKTRRQYVQPAFHPNQIEQYTRLLPAILGRYRPKWQKAAAEKVEFDIFKDLRLIITDFNFQMLFSEILGEEEMKDIEAATLYVDKNFLHPMPLWVPTIGTFKFKKSVRKINSVFEKLIEKRQGQKSVQHKDLLQHLMSVPLTSDDLIGELASIYFGASVMSTSLAWAFALIGQNPEVMDLLCKEAVHPFDPTQLDRVALGKLEYSQAVIKEALRLFPPSFGYPRFSNEEFSLGAYKIPTKSLLIPMVYLVQRDPKYWDRPCEFRPERFLEGSPAIVANSYLPFGIGPRACLGAALAPFIMQTCLLSVARDFSFRFKPRFQNDPEPEFGFEIHPKSKVNVLFEKRCCGRAVDYKSGCHISFASDSQGQQ